jgi:nitroreductase
MSPGTHSSGAADDAALFEIMFSCRAMRRLKPDPVPEELLVRLVESAAQAPSSSNNQCWHFVIARGDDLKRRIQSEWRRGWSWYQEILEGAPQAEGEDQAMQDRQRRAGRYMIDHLHDAPALIAVCVRKDPRMSAALRSPRVLPAAIRHLGLGGALRLLAGAGAARMTGVHSTAYPAVQNLLLAARALGLGAVLTTPQLFAPGKYEEILGIPPDVTLTAIIPVGYPKGRFGPVSRPSADSLISWERYGG